MLSEWGNNIYTALSNDKIPPKDYDTQEFIIWTHYTSGCEYLYSLIRANHPNILTHPIYLVDTPPTKLKEGDPLYKYFHIYKYYLELRAHQKKYYATLCDPNELDTFILGANHCFKFRRRPHK